MLSDMQILAAAMQQARAVLRKPSRTRPDACPSCDFVLREHDDACEVLTELADRLALDQRQRRERFRRLIVWG